MSVPHLDRRHVDGEVSLLFGPYAGFSPKFLKHGSYFDLPKSVELENIVPMLDVAIDNLSLEKYLIGQVLEAATQRFNALLDYYPSAKESDWRLEEAGQRVQIIKHTAQKQGTLQFGTEIVHSADRSLAALLGASPGASTRRNHARHLAALLPRATQERLDGQVETDDSVLRHLPG